MEFNFSSAPNRRYLLRLGLAVAAFFLTVVAARYLIGQGVVSGRFVWVLALLPGLAMAGMFHAFGMLIVEQQDEFLRMLIVRQFIIGTGIAFSFATVWGFLERFGLVGHVYSYYFALVWFAGLGIGGVLNRLTHGAWGEMS